jgi:hypothetical protein
MRPRLPWQVGIVCVFVVLAGCSSPNAPSNGNSGGSSNPPSTAQQTELEGLMGLAFQNEFGSLSTALAAQQPGQTVVPISGMATCTKSGSVTASGSLAVGVNPNTGTGAETLTVTTTLNNCSDGSVTLTGNVTTTGPFNFVNFVPQNPATLTTSGTVNYSGSVSGSATFVCTTSVDTSKGTGTTTGNATFSGGVTVPCNAFQGLG